MFTELTDKELADAKREIAEQERVREHAKWDAELVGRYFRIIRAKEAQHGFSECSPLPSSDYVTLEESLSVGGRNRYVYADVVYIHIKSREESKLTCCGFEVSHGYRDEPYLKLQPVFYSHADFRNYFNTWRGGSGPAKHCDEIQAEEYEDALRKAVESFARPMRGGVD